VFNLLNSWQDPPDVTDQACAVEPNCEKFYLEQFYQDLPKYMPFLSTNACQQWERFKSENPTTLSHSTSLKWLLPDLHRASVLSAQVQDSVDHSISAEAIALVEKELAAPKQVSFCLIVLQNCFRR